jgi:isopenicillin-N N-acyltransferase like protein
MRRVFKWLLMIVAGLVFLLVVLLLYVMAVADIIEPTVTDASSLKLQRQQVDSTYYTIGKNWFHKDKSGLYEVYIQGDDFERGVILGKLSAELVVRQEQIFNNQINQLVPSSGYRKFLRVLIGWFNRDLDDYVPEEYKREIFGVSRSASHDYDFIAPAYQRILNYHGAHDIGHALQNMALVGCTSFAAWDGASEDSTLIIGRNFDFFVGEEFAKDKLIAFYNPKAGHKFMMVTWGGMTGVLSGMNDQGLTVTLNAAKSEIPSSAATPVSLVAREILQYASTIDEALVIARKRKTFVAESFMIGSAKDKRAAIIEKSPEVTTLFESTNDWIIGTNHFQSDSLGNTELNREHVKTSASVYRYDRVKELLLDKKLSVLGAASILRNKGGLHDEDIGLGNEKAINQLVAHHGIIFQPEKKLVWVSTSPWQMGAFVCYDLSRVFSEAMGSVVYDTTRTISADPFLETQKFRDYTKYFKFRFPFQSREGLVPDSMVRWNSDSYHAFMLAGDASKDRREYDKAIDYFSRALQLEIATEQERGYIVEQLNYCKEKLK